MHQTGHSARLLAHDGIQLSESCCLFCLWTGVTDLPESVEGCPLLADRLWAPPSHLLMCGETARVKRPEREGDLA
jgi:hypothetical protein